jgi:hypothetical protein
MSEKLTAEQPFYEAILRDLGAPVTKNNLLYLYGWRQAEGASARFNPFNTTYDLPGATIYNSHKVKNYVSAQDGVDATVKTLQHSRYATIVSALKASASPDQTAAALAGTPWGTGQLAGKVIAGYLAGASIRAKPIAGYDPATMKLRGEGMLQAGTGGSILWIGLAGMAAYYGFTYLRDGGYLRRLGQRFPRLRRLTG